MMDAILFYHQLGIYGCHGRDGRKNDPDIYFAHGTGYKSNGKNFVNYFGRIYQARYLSGIVAGMNTKTNKLG